MRKGNAKPTGFAEDRQAPFAAPQMARRLTVGRDGRLLIPADLREATGIRRGGVVFAEVRDGMLMIDSIDARIDRMQAIAAKYKKPGESVVDEFIAEKRAEAERE
jgi:bifunctional DNA-binding transcriptional regulator/antitoxin component of YhaV-PrlF toxin-antitoxin module